MGFSASKTVSRWFIFQNDKLLLGNLPSSNEPLAFDIFAELAPHLIRKYMVGEFNHHIISCGEISKNISLPSHIQAVSLRKAFDLLDSIWFRSAIQSFAIINWDKNHQFCGRCGHRTQHKVGAYERICEYCGLQHYPRISPSIIVLITRGDELLLARGSHFPPGVFGLIAGFVEVGENIEEAVHREVKEEVNLEINHLRYFGSQSWPFPDSLMIGFFADYANGEIEIDSHEIESAGWYRYDQLPGLPNVKISIARRLIDEFVNERKKLRG